MKDLETAAHLVDDVRTRRDEDVQAHYKRLSRSFPVLVRTAGLGQALAFSKEKARGEGSRAAAHSLLLQHVDVLLDVVEPLDALRYLCRPETSMSDYLVATRRVLGAWVYFKRFAVAMLAGEDGGTEE
jgi:CRISPR-associated protein Cmr5